MHLRYRILIASAVIPILLPNPSPISAQSTEAMVAVRVQAAQEVVGENEYGWEFFLDPRPERRRGLVTSLTFDSLASTGFPVYDRPEIPGPEVWLLSTKDLVEDRGGLTVSVRIHDFREYSQSSKGIPYRWGETIFRVTCDEESCALGDVTAHADGRGVVREECMANYFALSVEDREACRR